MSNISHEMEEILKQDIVERHSFFQLKHFVIGKEYTIQGKLWQCLREIRTRKNWIEAQVSELEEANDRLELLTIEDDRNSMIQVQEQSYRSDWEKDIVSREFAIKRRQIDRQIVAVQKAIAAMKKKMKDYEEEARFFVAEFRQLQEIEPVRPLDDIDAQKEYWTAKLHQEVNLKMLLQQPFDVELVKMVLSLNDDSALKQSVLKILEINKRAILEARKQELE